MPSREWRFRIEDMLEAISAIARYVQGLSFDDFKNDRKTFDAVIRNLEIMGEAARYVPDDVAARHPGIRWNKMREMRNVLAHVYFGVNISIVWQTIQEDLPPMADKLRAVLSEKP